MNSSTKILFGLLAVSIAACSGPKQEDMFSGDMAKRAVDKIVAELGDKNGDKNPKVLKVRITSAQVEMNVENAKKRGTVQNWWYYKLEVGGPRKVSLYGSGSLAASLFDLSKIDFKTVPKIIADAKKLWGKDVKEMVLRIPVRAYSARSQYLKWTINFKGGSFTYATVAGKVAPRMKPRKKRKRK